MLFSLGDLLLSLDCFVFMRELYFLWVKNNGTILCDRVEGEYFVITYIVWAPFPLAFHVVFGFARLHFQLDCFRVVGWKSSLLNFF